MRRVLATALLLLAFAPGTSVHAHVFELSAPEVREDGWPTENPLTAGFNEARLLDLTRRLRVGEYLDTYAVVIEHDGALVYEHYQSAGMAFVNGCAKVTDFGPENRTPVFSVSKSVTALLLGIVLGRHEDVTLDTPVLSVLPDSIIPADPDANTITIEHALTMTAGLSWDEFIYRPCDGSTKFNPLFRQSRPIEYLFSQPLSDTPGTTFNYNTGLTVALSGVIAQLEGAPFEKVARDLLFEPLGITLGGLTVVPPWGPNGGSVTAVDMNMSARDLAKIGAVMIDSGRWQGEQIVPSAWIEESSRIYRSDADNDFYDNYGYHWWLRDFAQGGRTFPAIVARGLGGQRIFVLPERDLVVTVLADHPPEQRWASERLLLDILGALE